MSRCVFTLEGAILAMLSRISVHLIVVLFGLMLGTQAQAVPIDFKFSFENVLNGGGTVTGFVRGLEEGTGAATSVEVTDNTMGFGIGEYIGNPLENSWTVVDGVVTAFNFLSFGIVNSDPAVTDSTLRFDSTLNLGAEFRAGLRNLPDSVFSSDSAFTTSDIALTFTQVSPVPLPASLPLFLGGLLILRKLRSRHA